MYELVNGEVINSKTGKAVPVTPEAMAALLNQLEAAANIVVKAEQTAKAASEAQRALQAVALDVAALILNTVWIGYSMKAQRAVALLQAAACQTVE